MRPIDHTKSNEWNVVGDSCLLLAPAQGLIALFNFQPISILFC